MDPELRERVKTARAFLKERGQPDASVNRIDISPYGEPKGIWINLTDAKILRLDPFRELPVDQSQRPPV